MKKKFTYLICAVMIVSVLFSGCGTDKADGSLESSDLSVQIDESDNVNESENTDKSVTGESEAENTAGKSAKESNLSADVKIVKDDRPIKDSSGKIRIERYYEKAVLKENNDKFKNINTLIQNNCDEFFAAKTDLDNMAFQDESSEEEYYDEGEDVYFSKAEVKNNNNSILSIKLEHNYCMGGAYNINYYGLNYDLNTGNELKLTDVFSMSEAQICDYLKSETIKYIDKNPNEGWWDDNVQSAKQNVNEYSLSDFEFYIEGNDICLCYPTYELGPGAMGPVIVKCPIV